MTTSSTTPDTGLGRHITLRTRGAAGNGPITRLMSPSDLGQLLKPFVFLDIFDVSGDAVHAMESMPIHPHSGIATVTVFTEGRVRYDDPGNGQGTFGYGGVEWMRAGGGIWHGKELTAEEVPRIQGFQLWIALPADLENAEPESRYIESVGTIEGQPAHVILGNYQGVQSPVPAPEGVNYLLVTLKPGERWVYHPPIGHSVGWLAVAKGALNAEGVVRAGEMVSFDASELPITLHASDPEGAVFVLGSAVPHPHPLHLGYYSVHTNAQSLEKGERRIAELGKKLQAAGDRRTESGTTPVFR
ncbi:Pirin-related protein [Pseudomonas syringae pv. delphinii]|uniref:Pirin-related protein n=2 Tax=Pseudomonas syringae group genomosp. 3 TaxID=251701 RepID=A0A0P9RCY8_9PSED|nr:pirin family protein [Pseudomonas syringae group genomosp. 3]KPX26356.1 Pirin-related protein [Pseudomonas syringae pv. delphinii]RMP12995.1 Pirin-related protein [Pseudomonas syringae pv. delphinii]RMP16463.1 Pirin-related protein [Pseudomonas syringae pv. delphinii]